MYIPDTYKVTVSCPDRGITVEAPVPETFMFDTSAHYEAPFSSGVTGKIANTLRLFGVKPVAQIMTAQLWQGSGETDLGLELEFQAEQDAEVDVLLPVMALNILAAPQVEPNTQALMAPGPSLGPTLWQYVKDSLNVFSSTDDDNVREAKMNDLNSTLNGQASRGDQPRAKVGTVDWARQYIANEISLRIGKYAYFESVAITSVVQTFSHQFDSNGIPLHATVGIRFRPMFLVTNNDIMSIFGRQGFSQTFSPGSPIRLEM